MDEAIEAVVERFVVEHVLLGLGNIRARLGELEAAEARGEVAPPLQLAVVAGHIDELERRARRLQDLLRSGSDRPGTSGAPLFASRRPSPAEARTQPRASGD